MQKMYTINNFYYFIYPLYSILCSLPNFRSLFYNVDLSEYLCRELALKICFSTCLNCPLLYNVKLWHISSLPLQWESICSWCSGLSGRFLMVDPLSIYRSSLCFTTGVTNAMVCVILSMGCFIVCLTPYNHR